MFLKKNKIIKLNNYFMNLAYLQAKKSLGLTGTNPPVGCIITDIKNNIISLGRTGKNGTPHAEFNAINSIQNLKGANIYTTIEPCTHYGKTPPCANLIIKNKIKKVFYSINDYDKITANKAKKKFQQNKIIISEGLLKKEINSFYKFYLINKSKKIPYIISKLAISNDGFINNKKKKNITNNNSRRTSHLLRSKNNGIMITSKTLVKDNPLLTCRIKGLENHSPKRIILDVNLITPIKSKIVNTSKKIKTIFFYNKKKPKKISIFKKKGIKLIKLNVDSNKRFDLTKVFKILYKMKISKILVEGGKIFTNELINKKLINEFYLFKSFKRLNNDGYNNVNSILKKITKISKSKKQILTNLDKDILYHYKF